MVMKTLLIAAMCASVAFAKPGGGNKCPDGFQCIIPRGGTDYACVDAADEVLEGVTCKPKGKNRRLLQLLRAGGGAATCTSDLDCEAPKQCVEDEEGNKSCQA